MLEKEIKVMLDEEEYRRLGEALEFSGEVCQVNHYYFSAACSQKRISVRVREVEGKKLLQVKLPVSTVGSLAVREERERELDNVPQTVPADVLAEICGVEEPAQRLGSLATVRKLCYSFPNVEIALDKNEYLGITDYELEAEYSGDYPEEVTRLLDSLGIDPGKPAVGKYSRFLDALGAGG